MVTGFIIAASGLFSTTYGYGELNCGDAPKTSKTSIEFMAQINTRAAKHATNASLDQPFSHMSIHEFLMSRSLRANVKTKAKACVAGAMTASGEQFRPYDEPTAAVAMPRNVIMRPAWVYLRLEDGECHRIRVNDKMNERYIGKRGFDLSPAAQALLTGSTPSRSWSAKVYVCGEEEMVASL